jgi:hypothetical protein
VQNRIDELVENAHDPANYDIEYDDDGNMVYDPNDKCVLKMFDNATAMLRELPHLRSRDPIGTPNIDDWKADMYPRNKLLLDFLRARDQTKFVHNLMNRMVKNPNITDLPVGVIDELEDHHQRYRQHLFEIK